MGTVGFAKSLISSIFSKPHEKNLAHREGKECRSIVRDESSVYFNVTAVNRYDI